MIGICTDSSAQLPADLAAHYGIEVVPLTVVIDGDERLDGVDLDADAFYAAFHDGRRPDVAMCQPSPGQFAAAYEDLVARGCTEILSLHVTGAFCATLSAARLAAHATQVPVRVVDSGRIGFGVGCCVWAAADAAVHGATAEQAVVAAERAARDLEQYVLLRHPEPADHAMNVVLMDGATVGCVEEHQHTVDAINAVAARVVRRGQRVRVGVGHSDRCSQPVADALEAALAEAAAVAEVVRYRIGPSLGTLAGPGTIGCVVSPAG